MKMTDPTTSSCVGTDQLSHCSATGCKSD